MEWSERKAFYNEHFFTVQCVYISDGETLYGNDAEFAAWLLKIADNPKTVLDCGCATGALLFGFSGLRPDLETWGFELSEYAVTRAIPEIKERILLLDCATEPIQFPDQYFDLCTAIEFFEHQDDQHIENVVEEITRVTKEYLFVRQPFTKFNMPVEKRAKFLVGLNSMSHRERLGLIDTIPEVTTSIPDPGCPFHPQERSRQFFLELFGKYHFEEQVLEEDAYKYPNPGVVCSFNTLLMRRVGSS